MFLIGYSVEQALLFSADAERIDRIYGRLAKYGIAAEKNAIMTNKIRLASNWADDQGLQSDCRSELDLTQKDKDALRELIQALREFKGKENYNDSPKILQSRIFDISRRNEVKHWNSLPYCIGFWWVLIEDLELEIMSLTSG